MACRVETDMRGIASRVSGSIVSESRTLNGNAVLNCIAHRVNSRNRPLQCSIDCRPDDLVEEDACTAEPLGGECHPARSGRLSRTHLRVDLSPRGCGGMGDKQSSCQNLQPATIPRVDLHGTGARARNWDVSRRGSPTIRDYSVIIRQTRQVAWVTFTRGERTSR